MRIGKAGRQKRQRSDTKWTPENRVQFMEEMGAVLGFQRPEDWYQIRQSHFREHGGWMMLITYYKGSVIEAVRELYPDEDWLEWKFGRAPDDFWDDVQNRWRYLIWLGEKLGYEKPEDWYGITKKSFMENHGYGFLYSCYRNAPLEAVRDIYPQLFVHPWKFKKGGNKLWSNDDGMKRRYLDWLFSEMVFEDPEDWYRITAKDFYNNHGGGLLKNHFGNSPLIAVTTTYPELDLRPENFAVSKKSQRHLYDIACGIQGRELLFDYRHPSLRFPDSGYKMELDVFDAQTGLALEYQGEQHYLAVEIWGGEDALEQQQKRDQFKREACQAAGIRLVEVPYTWNGQAASLKRLISRSPA